MPPYKNAYRLVDEGVVVREHRARVLEGLAGTRLWRVHSSRLSVRIQTGIVVGRVVAVLVGVVHVVPASRP